jgi:hypothetical protein
MRLPRTAVLSLVGAVAVAVVAALAAAALEPRLAFDRRVARVGERVTATTVGSALRGDHGPYWVFLVARQDIFRVRSIGDRRYLHYVGTLSVDKAGNGRLGFRVPTLVPGFYVAELACDHCGPKGLEPVGPFPGGFRVV